MNLAMQQNNHFTEQEKHNQNNSKNKQEFQFITITITTDHNQYIHAKNIPLPPLHLCPSNPFQSFPILSFLPLEYLIGVLVHLSYVRSLWQVIIMALILTHTTNACWWVLTLKWALHDNVGCHECGWGGIGCVNSFWNPLGITMPCVYVRCTWCLYGCGCGSECECKCVWDTCRIEGSVESLWCFCMQDVCIISSLLPLIALAVASASSYAGASGWGVIVIGMLCWCCFLSPPRSAILNLTVSPISTPAHALVGELSLTFNTHLMTLPVVVQMLSSLTWLQSHPSEICRPCKLPSLKSSLHRWQWRWVPCPLALPFPIPAPNNNNNWQLLPLPGGTHVTSTIQHCKKHHPPSY